MKSPGIFALPMIAASLVLMTGCGAEAGSGSESTQQSAAAENVLEESLELTVEDVLLSMETDGTLLTVSISAPTTGWVAVGFDPSAAMKDANIIIAYVADGEVFLRDDWGSGHTSHEADTEMGGTELHLDGLKGLASARENGGDRVQVGPAARQHPDGLASCLPCGVGQVRGQTRFGAVVIEQRMDLHAAAGCVCVKGCGGGVRDRPAIAIVARREYCRERRWNRSGLGTPHTHEHHDIRQHRKRQGGRNPKQRHGDADEQYRIR